MEEGETRTSAQTAAPEESAENKKETDEGDKKRELARKTRFFCAIDPTELNRVELAFFKRKPTRTILTDR